MALIDACEVRTKDGRKATFRCALESDAGGLLANLEALVADGAGQILLPGEYAPTLEEERAFVRAMREDPGKLLLVVEVEGAHATHHGDRRAGVVGALDFKCSPRKRLAHTGSLGIALLPAFRGIGLGEALLRRMLAWVEEQPAIEKVNLHVLADNTAAIGLYRKLGFREEGRLEREVRHPDGRYVDALVMARFRGAETG